MSGFENPRDGPRPRAILFDWDNTLIDSWAVIHECQNATLEAFGHKPWTLEQTRKRVRKSMRDSFPGLFGKDWEEAGEFFYRRFHEIHLEKLAPLSGAAEMLADLAGQGIYLGVVSNKKGKYLRREAVYLGWDGYFGKLVGALDAKADKPAAAPVHMALRGSGIEAGPEVWFAGDACVDLECAVNSGCIPVLVRGNAPGETEFGAFPPAWHVEGCMPLSKLVKSL